MAEDIIFTIGAETSSLDNALNQSVQRVKSNLGGSAGAGGGGGGIGGGGTTAAGAAGAGGGGGGGGGGGTAAAAAATAASTTTAATQMGQFSRHAQQANWLMQQMDEFAKGIGYTIGAWNLGFMVAEKLVDGIKDALSDVAQTQAAELRFEAFASNTTKAANALAELQNVARETGTNIKTLLPSMQDLGRYGMQGQTAVDTLKNLAEFSHVANIPLKDLTDTYNRLTTHQAGITEMLNTSTMLSESTQKAVQAYHQRVIDAPIVEAHEQRRIELQNREYQEGERQRGRQLDFIEKIGLAQRLAAAYMAPRGIGEEPREPILMPGMIELEDKFWAEMKAGMAQLQADTGLSETQLRRYFATGQLGEKDLLAAAKERHQEEQLAIQRQNQDVRYAREEGQRQEMIRLQRQEADEIQRGVGLQEKNAQWMETIEGHMATASEHMTEMWEHSKELLDIMTKWAEAIDKGVTNLQKGVDAYNSWGEKASQRFERWEQRTFPGLLPASPNLSNQDLQQLHNKLDENNKLTEEQNAILRTGLLQ